MVPPHSPPVAARAVRLLARIAYCALALAAAPCLAAFGATKTFAPGTIASGGSATMTISLVDSAGSAVDSITFDDTFPAGMTAVPGSGKAINCGPTVTLTIAPSLLIVSGGQSGKVPCDIQVTVTATVAATTTLVNTTNQIAYHFLGVPMLTIPGVSGALQVVVGVAPAITSPVPPSGLVGIPYDHRVTVTGTPPIAVSAAGLPPGLGFSAVTLRITGIPTVPGSYFGVITASNGIPPDAQQPFTIVIAAPPLTIVTPPAVLAVPVPVGATIDVALQAVGGLPPYVWTVAGGTLPPGVTLDPGGGLSGKLGKVGAYTFDAKVTDAFGASTTQTYRIDVVQASGVFDVKVTPNPATSGQTVTIAASVTGPLPATGTLEVWVAGTGMRCPAPFGFGDPASPVAPLRTASFDASGRASVALVNLKIDDYGVCAHYGGDTNYKESFAGPIDLYVIKGALLSPTVALAAPARVVGLGAIPARVTVSSPEAPLVPRGTVRVRANGEVVAAVALADGTAGIVLGAPAAPDTLTLIAEYDGDGTFAPAASAPVAVGVVAGDGLPIPTLSEAGLALLALALAVLAARRLRRRP